MTLSEFLGAIILTAVLLAGPCAYEIIGCIKHNKKAKKTLQLKRLEWEVIRNGIQK